jgi:DnaJ-class molecular chaperone
VTHVLIVLALIAGYAVFLLIRPTRACRRCSGWGARNKRRGHRSYCARCKGTGRTFRLGSRIVHRGAAEAYRYARKRMEVNR